MLPLYKLSIHKQLFEEVILKRFLKAIFIAALVIFSVRVACAQSTATVSGTVTDPSGALVPQAQITLHGNATGITRVVTSDNDGNYTIPSIQPGDYSLEASAAGSAGMSSRALCLRWIRSRRSCSTLGRFHR